MSISYQGEKQKLRRVLPEKQKIRRLLADADCPGCNVSGTAVIYYNPNEATCEQTKKPICPDCGGKITYKYSHTPTYMATSPITLVRTRTCSSCGYILKDTHVVFLKEWEDLTNVLPNCPKCKKGVFDSEFTELDNVLYTYVHPDPLPYKGKKRVLILNGRCECGFGADKTEIVLEPPELGKKGWTPTNHNQTCPNCNQEYWLDWRETERTYL